MDKEKERAHAEMKQILEEFEAILTKAMNELSEMQKIIQEQAKQIEEKDQEGSSDALISKDKEIIAAAENFRKKSGFMQKCQKGLRTLRRY